MKKLLTTCAILFFLFSSTLWAEVSEIKVWSPDFKEIKAITNPKDITTILEMWAETEIEPKKTIQPLKHGKPYKIDFKGDSKSINGRWLYNKTGYYRLLSKAPQKTYKVKNVNKLNQQLGI